MATAALRRWLAAIRRPSRAWRLAFVLWIAWSVIVWNVVFDHVIVMASREYLVLAGSAAAAGGPFARMQDAMRPAIRRAALDATLAAAATLAVGLPAILFARRAGGRAA